MQYKNYTGPFGKPLKPLVGRIEDYYHRLNLIFDRFKEVKIVYLFGSHAKGTIKKTSDVDIAIVTSNIELDRYKKLWAAISDVLSTERFDLITLDDKPISFMYEVIKKGKLIYVVDERLLNDFELHTIKIYLDTKPLRFLNAKIFEERLNGL